ncbi:hypothetical protein GCM10010407_17040 [Rarobacter incanus]
MGIRPVLTWKFTAAAPTPIRDGATSVFPTASVPWQVAQFAWKSAWPAATSSEVAEVTSAVADDGANAEYAAPVKNSASVSSSTGAKR